VAVDHLGDAGRRDRPDRLGCRGHQRPSGGLDHRTAQIDETQVQIAVGEIDPHRKARFGAHDQGARWLSAPASAGRLLDQQALIRQLLDHLRDRRPGEAGATRDVGARRWAVAPDDVQHPAMAGGQIVKHGRHGSHSGWSDATGNIKF